MFNLKDKQKGVKTKIHQNQTNHKTKYKNNNETITNARVEGEKLWHYKKEMKFLKKFEETNSDRTSSHTPEVERIDKYKTEIISVAVEVNFFADSVWKEYL